MTAVIPGPKILPTTRVQGSLITIVNVVVTLIASVVRSIDGSLFFSKLKLLILTQ